MASWKRPERLSYREAEERGNETYVVVRCSDAEERAVAREGRKFLREHGLSVMVERVNGGVDLPGKGSLR